MEAIKGIVGEQYETKGYFGGQQLEGGASQIEFEKYNPWGDEGTWKDYLENISIENDATNKPFEKILK